MTVLIMFASVHLNYLLLFLTSVAWVCARPSSNLDGKNREISWEAWLLVDDQNQHREVYDSDSQIPRRRISAKSVFVAPSFSPEDLPPCAEGYSSDPMGRCVKIIKLDEDKHLDFLVSKLNQKFGNVLDYETMIEVEDPKAEPTRFDLDIPMEYSDDYSNDTPQDEMDMAIIVTPTTKEAKPDAEDDSKLDKRDDLYEEELKRLLKLTTTTEKVDVTTLGQDLETTTVGEPEVTTSINNKRETSGESITITASAGDLTTLLPTTTEEEATTTDVVESTTTTDPSTTMDITTMVPTTTEAVETTTAPKVTTSTPKITTYHPQTVTTPRSISPTTFHPPFDLNVPGRSRTKNLVKFPVDEPVIPRSHPNGDIVRFPDVDAKFQQESLSHHTRNVDGQTGNFFNEIVTSQPSQLVHEIALPPRRPLENFVEASGPNYMTAREFPPKFFPSGEPHTFRNVPVKFFPSGESQEALGKKYQYHPATTEHYPMKKMKFERHHGAFVFQPKYAEDLRPIVLRSVPMDDLTYLFGRKNGQTSHR